jgi:predicted O-methyltransferase YrrM
LNPDSLPGYLDGKTKFDLIFIDGAHDYESVKADIEIATRHIVLGGIICGHDFNMFKGVSEAAIEFEVDAICGTVWWKEMT